VTTRQLSLLVWSALGVALVACEVAAVLTRGAIPRFGTVVRRVVANPVGRVLLLLVWMWQGWHQFVR
jgi:hypothetical protein